MGLTRHNEDLPAWPPLGWPQLAKFSETTGQAVVKTPAHGKIFGLQYNIESVALFKDAVRLFRHDIQITGWEYSIHHESTEYPVLRVSLLDRFDPMLARDHFVTDIRAYDSFIPHHPRSISRALSAIHFLIRKIEDNEVPDVGRVLRVYKLHPSQSFLYRESGLRESDLKTAFVQSLAVRPGHKRIY